MTDPLVEEARRGDVEFLRWVAGWLDRIDPILRVVFGNPKLQGVTKEEQRRLLEWLDGTEVQERLRAIATDRAELVERLEQAEAVVNALKPFYFENRRDAEGLCAMRMLSPLDQVAYM